MEGGKNRLASRYLKNLNYANSLNKKDKKEKEKKKRKRRKQKEGNNDEWGFYEYHHGRKRTPEGRKGLTWSASAFIIGYQSINGKKVFI